MLAQNNRFGCQAYSICTSYKNIQGRNMLWSSFYCAQQACLLTVLTRVIPRKCLSVPLLWQCVWFSPFLYWVGEAYMLPYVRNSGIRLYEVVFSLVTVVIWFTVAQQPRYSRVEVWSIWACVVLTFIVLLTENLNQTTVWLPRVLQMHSTLCELVLLIVGGLTCWYCQHATNSILILTSTVCWVIMTAMDTPSGWLAFILHMVASTVVGWLLSVGSGGDQVLPIGARLPWDTDTQYLNTNLTHHVSAAVDTVGMAKCDQLYDVSLQVCQYS